MNPVILLGTERSGTNLLRRTLEAHSQIASLPPFGLITPMAMARHMYFNESFEGDVLDQWGKAASALMVSHPSYSGLKISKKEVLARVSDISHWGFYQAMNEVYAEMNGASIWFSKEPGALDYAYEILANIPDVKFIYLVRDGRDVAASMLKGGVHGQHIYQVAQRWCHDQVKGMQLLSDPVIKERIYLLRYEDFTANFDDEVINIFNFMGCSVEDDVLKAEESESVRVYSNQSKYWENLSKPVNKENSGKYKKHLTRSQINIFEDVARFPLDYFGYGCESVQCEGISTLDKALFKLQGVINRRKKLMDADYRRELDDRKKFQLVVDKVLAGSRFE